jgi:hypothetical protein
MNGDLPNSKSELGISLENLPTVVPNSGFSENEGLSSSPPSKIRRKKGDGSGYIYHRTVTRRGKSYPEFYYRYRDEGGKLRSKYIPQKLLYRVQEADFAKKSIADILILLGGDGISRGEQSENFPDENYISRGEQETPPSKKRRKQGYGGGYIECKPIKRNGKEYQQYWYHYEFWEKGKCLVKKSCYIPKRLLADLEKLEQEKAPVGEILNLFGKKK